MFKTYSISSSFIITSRWFAKSHLVAPVSVRLVYYVTMWRHKSAASSRFVYPFVKTNTKENINARVTDVLWGVSNHDRGILLTKGQLRRNHLVMSSLKRAKIWSMPSQLGCRFMCKFISTLHDKNQNWSINYFHRISIWNFRDHFVCVPSQWETTSRWLDAFTKCSLEFMEHWIDIGLTWCRKPEAMWTEIDGAIWRQLVLLS